MSASFATLIANRASRLEREALVLNNGGYVSMVACVAVASGVGGAIDIVCDVLSGALIVHISIHHGIAYSGWWTS